MGGYRFGLKALVGVFGFTCMTTVLFSDPREILENHRDVFPKDSQEDITEALESWEQNEQRDALLRRVVDRENHDLLPPSEVVAAVSPAIFYEVAVHQNVEVAREMQAHYIGSWIHTAEVVRRNLLESKKDTITTLSQAFTISLNKLLRASDRTMLECLKHLKSYLETATASQLILFRQWRPYFATVFLRYLEARVERFDTTAQWVDLFVKLDGSMREGLQPKAFKRFFISESASILDRETVTGVRRAWVNRETVSVAALAALTAAQGVCVVVTLGFCAATLPATASWSLHAGRFALQAGQATVGISSLIQIIDRYRFEGVSGLISVGTLIDALLVISALPSPGLKALASETTVRVFGHTFEMSRVASQMAQFRLRSSQAVLGLGVSYGSWQFVFAKSIAEKLEKKTGHPVDENEIRRQGMVYIMMGILEGFRAKNYKETVLTRSENFQSYRAALPSWGEKQIKGFKRFTPSQSFGNIYSGIKTLPSSFWMGARTTLKGTAYLTYQAIAAGTFAMIAYTYPDFIMAKNNKPLPELREGESALLLNGFASNDVLYYAFSSDYANRREQEKYADRVRGAFFDSREKFLESIRDHARTYGPIRYLKIMAHGVPGRILPVATQDIMSAADRSVIDAAFLESEMASIQAMAQEAFAPEAQIVIVSCLVGGNLENPTDYKEFHFEKDSGDQLINALGRSLLVKGGHIDSSRRIIMGLDGSITPLYRQIMDSSLISPQQQAAFEGELQSILKSEREKMLALNGVDIFSETAPVDSGEMAETLGHRVFSMYSRIWEIVFKFGINLEGGFFHERHRSDSFLPAEKMMY